MKKLPTIKEELIRLGDKRVEVELIGSRAGCWLREELLVGIPAPEKKKLCKKANTKIANAE